MVAQNLKPAEIKCTIRKRLKKSVKKTCSVKTLKNRIPVLQWLPNYNTDFLIQDIIAGLTVALTAIPQGIAYAVIAGLPPEYGLYGSLTTGFVYMIFGSCKDVTVGPTAIISTMTAKYASYSPDYAVLAAFLTGVATLLMGIFKLGFLVNFISMPVISGFTTAAALQIAASQLKAFFALNGPSGNFFAASVYNFVENIETAKIWDPILASVTIIMLIGLKRMGNGCSRTDGFIKKTRWFISLARNAVVVVFGMILAYILKVTTNSEPLVLIGDIGGGLPTFGLPPFSTVSGNQTETFTDMLQNLGPQFAILPLVSILESVAIAKAFAEGGVVDATQEMYAVGFCNLVGSFAQSLPVTGSFTRTALNHVSGVKTTAGGVANSLLIIVALTLLTSTFYYIPKASLAGLIITAMFSMIDYNMFFRLWRNSKMELSLLIVTMTVSLFVGLEYGIIAGIILEGLLLLYRTSVPPLQIKVEGDLSEVIVLPLSDSLSYCAAEHLRKVIVKASHEADWEAILVIDGSNLKKMDSTVASNLMILAKDFDKQSRCILFVNFQPELKDLCVDIQPEAENKFMITSSILDLVKSLRKKV